MALAGHHRLEPRPVAIVRGNEKGRVDRSIRYVRDSLFAARRFTDPADLNVQAREAAGPPPVALLLPQQVARPDAPVRAHELSS